MQLGNTQTPAYSPLAGQDLENPGPTNQPGPSCLTTFSSMARSGATVACTVLGIPPIKIYGGALLGAGIIVGSAPIAIAAGSIIAASSIATIYNVSQSGINRAKAACEAAMFTFLPTLMTMGMTAALTF